MLKRGSILLLAIIVGLLQTPFLAHAKTVHIQHQDEIIDFSDASPFLDDNHRIQVPLRFLAEALGYSIHYESNQKVTLTSEQTTIQLAAGKSSVHVNGAEQPITTAPIIKNDRFYAPLRILAETGNIPIQWFKELRLVVLGDDKPLFASEEDAAPARAMAKQGLSFKASAYSASAEDNGPWGNVDYFGNELKLGTIAVDPDVIPLGSTVFIEGYSHERLPEQGLIAKAVDIGGAVKGNHVDIFIPGPRANALKFGIQQVTIHLLEK